LDFIPENEEETNLSTKLVVSKEKDKIETLFTLICSFIAVAIVFATQRCRAHQ
jgi:hypothetical protein